MPSPHPTHICLEAQRPRVTLFTHRRPWSAHMRNVGGFHQRCACWRRLSSRAHMRNSERSQLSITFKGTTSLVRHRWSVNAPGTTQDRARSDHPPKKKVLKHALLTEKSTVTAYGTPISSVREYRLPMLAPVVSMMLLRPACEQKSNTAC